MADTSTLHQQQQEDIKKNENVNTQTVGGQQETGSTSNSENAQKNSWLLQMPGLNQLVQRSIEEANQLQTPQYQLAGMNENEQAALNTLMQGRDATQLQSILGQYQKQAASFTNYGAQQSQINDLAKGYYQSDLVNQQKQQLSRDINEQLGGAVRTLNQQAVGSGNMASSRAGVTEAVTRGKAMDAISKGNAEIENSARTSAYNMAASQYQAGQEVLYNSLGVQANLANQLAGWNQQDAQTRYNAANLQRQYQQQQLDVTRQNQILKNTQAGQALTAYLPSWSELATFGQNVQSASSGASSTNTAGTSSTQQGTTSNMNTNTQTQGSSTGPATNWGQIAGSAVAQAAGAGLVQPALQAASGYLFGTPGQNGQGGTSGHVGDWISQAGSAVKSLWNSIF